MGRIRGHPPVKYFCALLYRPDFPIATVEDELTSKMGEIEQRSETFPFDHTRYYGDEMGTELNKYFVVFNGTAPPGELVSLKHFTNEIEGHYADDSGHRQVNLDPGYVSEAKVLLATTKNFDHRIYLDNGIYGDIQLRLRFGTWVENDWTYPDYRLPWVQDFFLHVRKEYWHEVKDRIVET